MSTNYVLDTNVSTVQFAKAMAELNYEKDMSVEQATDDYFPFTDGKNWAWVSMHDGRVANFTSFGRNDDSLIYEVAGQCGAGCYHEHEEEFHQILEADDDNCGMVSISIADLEGMATDIVSIGEDGKCTHLKKDGKLLS